MPVVAPPLFSDVWLSVRVETGDGRTIDSTRASARIVDPQPAAEGSIVFSVEPTGDPCLTFDGTHFSVRSAQLIGWEDATGDRWVFSHPLYLNSKTIDPRSTFTLTPMTLA